MSDERSREPAEKPYESDSMDKNEEEEQEDLQVQDPQGPLQQIKPEEEEIEIEEDVLFEKFEETMKAEFEGTTVTDESSYICDEPTEESKPEEDEYMKLVSEEWVSGLVPDLRSAYLQNQELNLSDENFPSVDKTLLVEAASQAKQEVILDEDNPLVKKFQQVLKTHLLRQIEKIKTNIQELEGEYKQKELVHKEDTENVYKAEQIVLRQRENLDNYKDKIEQVTNLRERIENDMKIQEGSFKELKKMFEDRKNEMDDCQAESEMLAELVKKMSDYDKEQEKEIKLSKRQQDINLKDRERLSKEKQALDMTLWRLEKQILAKKRETEGRLNKCKSKAQECEVVSNKLLQATVERAGLLMENQSISKELQKSFFRIKQLDNLLQKTKTELEMKDDIDEQSMTAEVKEAYSLYFKCQIGEQNKSWAPHVCCVSCYVTLVQWMYGKKKSMPFGIPMIWREPTDHLEMMREKKNKAIEELNMFDELMKTTEKELNNVIQRTLSLQADEEIIMKQIVKVTNEKTELEKAYLEKLSSLERTDKMMKNMNDMIAKMVDEHQKQELKMYKIENHVSRLMVEMEEVKGSLRDVEHDMDSITRLTRETEEALKAPEERLKQLQKKEIKYKNDILEKKKELENLELALKHKTYLDTPLFIKKRNIEYNIKQLQNSIKEKENLWMQMQEGCLQTTKKRNDQLEKINCLKKQISMMKTSLERTSNKIKQEQTTLRDILSELNAVTHRMEHLKEAEIKQGQAKVKAEESNKDREEEFIEVLKGLEKNVMKIQQEIWDLEEKNQELKDTVESYQKELLEWGKKYDLAVEMKKEMDMEKNKGGEIAAMKSEIHRMQVRYTNLRKAEEKMITDLEVCLGRRDSIFDSAEAREKRAKACGVSSRVFAFRKLEETKAKLRTMLRAVRELKQEKEACLTRRKELSEELNFWRSSVERLSQSLQQLEQQIQEGQIHRHRTLEMTVMRQRKSKLLEELRMGRYRVAATEDNLMVQEENVCAIRNALLHIIDELKNDFPTLNLQLIQIENTVSYNIDPDV